MPGLWTVPLMTDAASWGGMDRVEVVYVIAGWVFANLPLMGKIRWMAFEASMVVEYPGSNKWSAPVESDYDLPCGELMALCPIAQLEHSRKLLVYVSKPSFMEGEGSPSIATISAADFGRPLSSFLGGVTGPLYILGRLPTYFINEPGSSETERLLKSKVLHDCLVKLGPGLTAMGRAQIIKAVTGADAGENYNEEYAAAVSRLSPGSAPMALSRLDRLIRILPYECEVDVKAAIRARTRARGVVTSSGGVRDRT